MSKNAIILIALVTITSWSCTYDQGDEIISGNIAPPDPTVSNVLKENYINRTYISLVGRKPSEPEFQEGLNLLNTSNASAQNRSDFLDILIAKDEYYQRLYDLARADLLNNVDTATVSFFIYLFEDQLMFETNPLIRELIQDEIDKLSVLNTIPQELRSGSINVAELHRRCLFNIIYDEINMGTENFVVSAFQNLLSRTPTSAEGIENNELQSASEMVDGFQAILFLQVGDSKEDFLNIMTTSNDYFEAQVVQQYNRFLFRDPTSEEMIELAKEYRETENYSEMQKSILSSDEYLGIE